MRKKLALIAVVVFVCLVSLSFQAGKEGQKARRISGSDLRDARFMKNIDLQSTP